MISHKNILEMSLRRKIFQFICDNPGFHQSEITKRTNIPKSTLLHHLKFLEKQKLISTSMSKGYTRYYPSNKLGKIEKKIMNFLREETTRDIFLMLLFDKACSQIEVSEALEKNPATILFHLKKLVDADLIEPAPIKNRMVLRLRSPNVVLRSPVHNEIIYRFKRIEIIRIIYKLMITYQNSLAEDDFLYTFIERMKEDVKYNASPYIKLLAPKDRMDAVEEAFYEIFPHPYHA